jgi:hypothetical protein
VAAGRNAVHPQNNCQVPAQHSRLHGQFIIFKLIFNSLFVISLIIIGIRNSDTLSPADFISWLYPSNPRAHNDYSFQCHNGNCL